MENASKALIMAGGVLISLLVIGLLVFFYNSLSSLQGTKQTVAEEQTVVEWNKQYTVYERDVYGSELLSLANKTVDYNKREADNKGYTKLEIHITITKNLDNNYFKAGVYNASKFEEQMEELNTKLEEIGEKTVKSKTTNKSKKISQLAAMRTKDIEELGIQYADYNENVTTYNIYKTLVTEVKSKTFRYKKSEYDNNGRIVELYYEL